MSTFEAIISEKYNPYNIVKKVFYQGTKPAEFAHMLMFFSEFTSDAYNASYTVAIYDDVVESGLNIITDETVLDYFCQLQGGAFVRPTPGEDDPEDPGPAEDPADSGEDPDSQDPDDPTTQSPSDESDMDDAESPETQKDQSGN